MTIKAYKNGGISDDVTNPSNTPNASKRKGKGPIKTANLIKTIEAI
jgi:hypothetical protein